MEKHCSQRFLIAFAILLAFIWIPAESVAQSSCSPFDVTPLDNGLYNFQRGAHNVCNQWDDLSIEAKSWIQLGGPAIEPVLPI
jgi:hypothetical protein